MKRKTWGRLHLSRETVLGLNDTEQLRLAVGGSTNTTQQAANHCCMSVTSPPLNQSGGCSQYCPSEACICSTGGV